MDHSDIPSYTRHWRTLYQHRQQWYQSILGAIMNYHFGILLPHFLFTWLVTALILGPSPMRPLSLHLLAILLSLAARLTWTFLFRHPGQFAGLKRPGLAYRWTVLAVCGATTVPNLCVHAVVLGRSFRGLREEEASLMAAKLEVAIGAVQTGLLGGASMVCVWMVWRFLVDWEDEMYDPCVKSELEGRRLRSVTGEFEPGREPYSDTPHSSVSRRQGTAAINYFAVAYAKQRIEASMAAQEPERSHQRDIPRDSIIEQEQGEGAVENQDIAISVEGQSPTPLRCLTVARYDYMDKNHTGAHSWLSYPLIPALIFSYSSMLSIPMIMFINETRHSKTPSPKAKKGLLYTLLGSYLLCFYALKHRLRRSLFEKFELPLPEPWIQASPFRGRNQFKRLYAGPPTTLDPRLRAIPPTAVFNPAAIRTKGYMQAYNAHPSSCTQYWGHQGRQQRSTSLTIPTVLRVGFIGLAALLYLNGYRCILSYPVTYGVDFGESDEDRRRLDRIAYWKIFLLASMVPQMIFIVMHALGSAGSMLMLWLKCHLKYVEIENQDRQGTFDDYARGAVPSVGQRSDRGERSSGSG